MDSTKWISKKIALLGSHGVGKTSLINQFVFQKFPENYLTTIGLKVDKKTLEIDDFRVDLVIWDIAGQDHMANIPHYYLNGCSGVIFVVDLSRPSTYIGSQSQIAAIQAVVGEEAEVMVAGNKSDLLEPAELERVKEEIPIQPDFLTSAKMGENVDPLFYTLADRLLRKHVSQGA